MLPDSWRRTGDDFRTGKARQSAMFRDVSIRVRTAATEFQDRWLKPLGARPASCIRTGLRRRSTHAPPAFLRAETSSLGARLDEPEFRHGRVDHLGDI